MEVCPLESRGRRQMPVAESRLRMLENEVDHPLAEDAKLRRIFRQVDAAQPFVNCIEARIGRAVQESGIRLEFVLGKYHVGATNCTCQHFRQVPDVIGLWIEYRDEITQGILEPDPRGCVRVDFLRQCIDLQVGKAVLAGKTLEKRYAFILGGVVNDNQFKVADEGRSGL